MSRVVIENLSKLFPLPGGGQVRALEHASFTVEDKEFLVLVGPSGCGKTTTLRLIAGLEEPTDGDIIIDGRSMRGVPPRDREVAMVFQHHALYPHLSVYDNLAFGLRLRKCPRPELERRVRAAAGTLELTDCLTRFPHELSGGQRQRVALGRAMVRQPKVFLLDEPLSNLDAPMRALMRAELAHLHARLAATIIYVTHDQVEAMVLGHRLAVMRDGLIQQLAAPLELYRRPANLFVAGFLGWPPMNFFVGTLLEKNGTLFFLAQSASNAPPAPSSTVYAPPPHSSFPAPALRLDPALFPHLKPWTGKHVILGLRPEHISLAAAPARTLEPTREQTLEAVVDTVQLLGHETCVNLLADRQSFVARLPGTAILRPGQRLCLALDLRHALFFDPATQKAILPS